MSMKFQEIERPFFTGFMIRFNELILEVSSI